MICGNLDYIVPLIPKFSARNHTESSPQLYVIHARLTSC
jgi:hypothetical protein